MARKRGFDDLVADDSATVSPTSKRSKITETADDNDSTAVPNEQQLKAPGMHVQPLNHISELNYRNAAASSRPVNWVAAGAQMPPPTASRNKLRNTAAVSQPIQTSAGQRPVRHQSKKTSRPAAHSTMQKPALSQSFGIYLARRDSPLGLFNQQPFWDTRLERETHLRRIRGHDEMIRHFIWLLSGHDVQTSSAYPEAQSRACRVHYDCIMRFLHTPYSNNGLGVPAYSWDVRPGDGMLLQQLEADIHIAVDAFGRGGASLVNVKRFALSRQEQFFLLATSFVFSSIMKLLIDRSRRNLLVDHIDAQAWSWARSRAQLDTANTEKGHWPSKHTDNFFVKSMAMAIQDITVSNMPANCSAMDSLHRSLHNALLISKSLGQDTQAINAVEGIKIGGTLYMSIDKILEPIEADLQRQVGRVRADQAAQAAQAVLVARAQRQAQIQTQHRAMLQLQQQILAGYAPARQKTASVSQAAQGRVQPFILTPEPPVMQFSQHRSRSETVPRSATSTPASVSQAVLQEFTAPGKRKRSGDEAVDTDAISVLKKARYEWKDLPSSNFADIEVARPTRVAPLETGDSTQTTVEDNSGQPRSEKLESQQTTAERQLPVSPEVASFTEFLNSTDFGDQDMEQWFDFSAASSDGSSNTGGRTNDLVQTDDVPLDGSGVETLPEQPASTIQSAPQNPHHPPQTEPVRNTLALDYGGNMVSPKEPALPPLDDDEFRAFLETFKDNSFHPLESQDASLITHLAPASHRASRSNSDTSHLSNDEFLGLMDDTLKQTRDSIFAPSQ